MDKSGYKGPFNFDDEKDNNKRFIEWLNENNPLYLFLDTIYGPFDIEYEIRYKTSEGIHIKSKMYLKAGEQPPKDLKEGTPYAVLKESEPVGKLEEKEEQDDLWIKVSVECSYIESEGVWNVIKRLKERFIITIKQ